MDIRVPQLAEGVESGTVVAVLVSEGDQVQKDQTVVEIETQKAVATIGSPEAGKIAKIQVKEGDSVSVGSVLMTLGEGDGEAPAKEEEPREPTKKEEKAESVPQRQQQQQSSAQTQTAPLPKTGGPVHKSPEGFPPPAAPSIRKLAQEIGLDLAYVPGSERGGRITLQDVRSYIQRLQQQAASGQPSAATPAPKRAAPSIDFSKWGPVNKKKMTELRKAISQNMTDSWQSIPRVTQFDDIQVEGVMALRKKHVEAYKKKGVNLTLTTFVIKAVAKTLKQFPVFNTSLDENTQELIFKEYYHIGIAVDTEHGLMVPVLRDADKKDFFEISKELAELAEKTRARKLALEDMKGGTFTISNQGGIGGKHFTPVVNKPEAAILGIGRGYEIPTVEKGKLKTKMVMPIGLSYDHRIIDGGQAARFVVALAEAMNSFSYSDVALEKSAGKTSSQSKKKKK